VTKATQACQYGTQCGFTRPHPSSSVNSLASVRTRVRARVPPWTHSRCVRKFFHVHHKQYSALQLWWLQHVSIMCVALRVHASVCCASRRGLVASLPRVPSLSVILLLLSVPPQSRLCCIVRAPRYNSTNRSSVVCRALSSTFACLARTFWLCCPARMFCNFAIAKCCSLGWAAVQSIDRYCPTRWSSLSVFAEALVKGRQRLARPRI
jgi:hypothetical protein